MKAQAVIGLGFGDEGKGKVVSYLCSQASNPIVVRFCGGHQAAHHVVLAPRTKDHVFSNFGCGSLQHIKTYWSEYCTVDPIGIINEYDVLQTKGITPVLYVNEKCPVTTPYEKAYNYKHDKKHKHGSCGVGVGQTFQREEDHYALHFSDLYYPSILRVKLNLLSKYYNFTIDIEQFIKDCDTAIRLRGILPRNTIPDGYNEYILEGSQGLLLDQNYGFFPHVTRSNIGTTNILKMGFTEPEIFLVTRAYQTRHGNGPMTNEGIIWEAPVNPYEQNSSDTFQGKFRIAPLDLDLLKYGRDQDFYLRNNNTKTHLVVTCLDLMKQYKLTSYNCLETFNTEDKFLGAMKDHLQIHSCYVSHTPYPAMNKMEE